MSPRFTTDAITRRDALKGMLLGAAGLALASRLSLPAWAAEQSAPAKSVIQIWMWGGPSHLDTLDPKPDAGNDYCGPFNTVVDTNVSGVKINAQLPLLANQADKYSIIRSMTHGNTGHETAAYIVQTGRMTDRPVYPGVGAVVSLFKGYDHGYSGLVPPYVVLTQPLGRFSESGFLGERYKPFCTGGDPNRTPFTVEGIVAPGITDERQYKRRDLLHALDTLGKDIPGNPRLQELDKSEAKAYDMMFGDTRKLFDLNEEKSEMRDSYGRNTFGQSCLMARRLVEHGVPYVTINYQGWDTHKDNFGILRRKLPEMDRAMASLLQDLSDRKLLDSTIVWWSGEFGRTPKIDWAPPWNGGRGHWGKCFSALLAGGGFKGGHVVGASDAKGEEVAERPVYPCDLIRSMYIELGIDPEGPMPNTRGLDVRVLPADEKGAKSGGILKEIM
jgi:hypothetical protein